VDGVVLQVKTSIEVCQLCFQPCSPFYVQSANVQQQLKASGRPASCGNAFGDVSGQLHVSVRINRLHISTYLISRLHSRVCSLRASNISCSKPLRRLFLELRLLMCCIRTLVVRQKASGLLFSYLHFFSLGQQALNERGVKFLVVTLPICRVKSLLLSQRTIPFIRSKFTLSLRMPKAHVSLFHFAVSGRPQAAKRSRRGDTCSDDAR
jgi:hypothetical protein